MKRQIDFDVWVRPFSTTTNPKEVLELLKSAHPFEQGWELMQTEVAQVGGGDIFIAYTFARYEYETVSTKVK